jgi:hypothetical protein
VNFTVGELVAGLDDGALLAELLELPDDVLPDGVLPADVVGLAGAPVALPWPLVVVVQAASNSSAAITEATVRRVDRRWAVIDRGTPCRLPRVAVPNRPPRPVW